MLEKKGIIFEMVRWQCTISPRDRKILHKNCRLSEKHILSLQIRESWCFIHEKTLLKAENLSNSEKQTLCSQLVELLGKVGKVSEEKNRNKKKKIAHNGLWTLAIVEINIETWSYCTLSEEIVLTEHFYWHLRPSAKMIQSGL